jgi:hypothetical protein
MRIVKPKDPCFLNVDLILYSKSDLQPLVAAMGHQIIVLYLGREHRSYKACLEISGISRSPEWTILKFCRLIQKLPRPAKCFWDGASVRMFDIGIDSVPRAKGTYWFEISSRAVAEAAKLNASIAVTVYGKLPMAKASQKARPSNPA